MAEFKFKGAQIIRRPQGGKIPHGGWHENALWIHMRPIKLESQHTAGQGGSISKGNESCPTFVFLAPNSIAETISHTWEAYESVQSRLAEKVRSVAKMAGETKALAGAFSIENLTNTFKDLQSSKGVVDIMRKIHNKVPGMSIPKMKVDTPLVYTNSKRRDWSFTFNLVSENKNPSSSENKNPSSDIVDVVQDLMKYSSPEMAGSSIDINLPYIFDLSTQPHDYIRSSYTALESVQPTWKGPYINGYPSMCELTLTFKDLSPLFRNTIETGSIINVK